MRAINPQRRSVAISDRRESILRARAYLGRHPVYLDTETTSADQDSAEMVDICVVDHDGSILLDTLVRPSGSIPEAATAIHGITNEMVRHAPTWSEISPRVAAALGSARPIGIYRVEFDLQVLRNCQRRARLSRLPIGDAFCVMRLYAGFRDQRRTQYPSPIWHTLKAASMACGIPCSDLHRARTDALLAREVVGYIARAPVD